MPAQVGDAEALCELPEQDESVQEQVNAWIGKAQARDALTAGGERTVDGLEGIFAEDAIMAEAFGLDEPTVRRKADLAQPRQVVQPPANPEVIAIVEGLEGVNSRASWRWAYSGPFRHSLALKSR